MILCVTAWYWILLNSWLFALITFAKNNGFVFSKLGFSFAFWNKNLSWKLKSYMFGFYRAVEDEKKRIIYNVLTYSCMMSAKIREAKSIVF